MKSVKVGAPVGAPVGAEATVENLWPPAGNLRSTSFDVNFSKETGNPASSIKSTAVYRLPTNGDFLEHYTGQTQHIC